MRIAYRFAHRWALAALGVTTLAGCGKERASPLPIAGSADSASALGDAAKDSALATTDALPAPSEIGAFHAAGTEPFWALVISDSGMKFSTPESQQGTTFPVSLPSLEGKTYRWTSSTPAPKGHHIDITIVERPCSDGMSDKQWTHAATVLLDGREFKGCAEPGLRPASSARPR